MPAPRDREAAIAAISAKLNRRNRGRDTCSLTNMPDETDENNHARRDENCPLIIAGRGASIKLIADGLGNSGVVLPKGKATAHGRVPATHSG